MKINNKENLLLLHGWDYLLYSSKTKSNDSWDEYKELIKELEKRFNIYKLNFPGFCNQKEPSDKEWNLNNYIQYVNKFLKNNNLQIDYVLGYSFGGAVATKWKTKTKSNAKLILIAPAIIRNTNKSHKFIKTPKFLNKLRKLLRDSYLIYIVKNNEMRYGTKFLRNSYQLIVREDLRKELFSINSKEIKLIYGSEDTAVAPNIIKESAPKSYKSLYMINGANHDNIITDYVDELIKIIDK